MTEHYLDWAASAPPYNDILHDAADIATKEFGNPSSPHGSGASSKKILDEARANFARVISASPDSITFTSGGSEGDSIPLLSLVRAGKPVSIVLSLIEHPAVYEQASMLEKLGVRLIRVRPGKDGIMDSQAVADAIRKDTALVAVMAVNNETGAIQPVASIVKAVSNAVGDSRHAPFFHCDAVQALGTIGFDALASGVDGAAFSGHKLGGPRGIGALYLRRAILPLVTGGGQEKGLRPGTHNTAGAWAFSQAALRNKATMEERLRMVRLLEHELLEGLRHIRGSTVLPYSRRPGDERYSPFIISMAFPGLGGEVMARLLDAEGIAVSTGSACASAKKDRRVLDAMGIERNISFSAIRVSMGRDSTLKDIRRFLEVAAESYSRYRI